MSCRSAITHSDDPVPPFFHLEETSVKKNEATGEIEQMLVFHGGVRIAICYSPLQAQQTGADLLITAAPPLKTDN